MWTGLLTHVPANSLLHVCRSGPQDQVQEEDLDLMAYTKPILIPDPIYPPPCPIAALFHPLTHSAQADLALLVATPCLTSMCRDVLFWLHHWHSGSSMHYFWNVICIGHKEPLIVGTLVLMDN